jgi:hypothetical protein
MKHLIFFVLFATALGLPVEKPRKRLRDDSPSDDPSDELWHFGRFEGFGDSTQPDAERTRVGVDPLFSNDVSSSKRRVKMSPYQNSWDSTLHFYKLDAAAQLNNFNIMSDWTARQNNITKYQQFVAIDTLQPLKQLITDHGRWLRRVSYLPNDDSPFKGIIYTYQVRVKHNFLLLKSSEVLMSLTNAISDLASNRTSPEDYLEVLNDAQKSLIEVEDYYNHIQVAH